VTEEDPRDLLPEVLAASGCCLMYCSQPEVWPQFEQWMREKEIIIDETINRDFLFTASHLLRELIQQVEKELLASKFEEYLATIDDNPR
jgi:hypothetical protein